MEKQAVTSKAVAEVAIDPVCGMNVVPGENDLVAMYKGCHYYFCAEACREAFEEDPEKYLEAMAPKRTGFWGRYLKRLNRATAGKSMGCH